MSLISLNWADGQLQSVYIYAISELFDGLQITNFTDEPDIHFYILDWYNFLKQIDLVSNIKNRTSNHIDIKP